jgi:hypothetical protein
VHPLFPFRLLKLGTAAISFSEFLIQETLFHGFES